MAEGGELDPFVLVVEGSIPNEDIKRKDIARLRVPTRRRANPFSPSNGSTGSRPKLRLLWLPAHVRHTVAFTPCRETQRAA